jgi:hypothetical protein
MRYEQVGECDVPRETLIQIGADWNQNNLGRNKIERVKSGVCRQQHVGRDAKIAANHVQRIPRLDNIFKQL